MAGPAHFFLTFLCGFIVAAVVYRYAFGARTLWLASLASACAWWAWKAVVKDPIGCAYKEPRCALKRNVSLALTTAMVATGLAAVATTIEKKIL